MGDAIDLTQRLQNHNKQAGVNVWASNDLLRGTTKPARLCELTTSDPAGPEVAVSQFRQWLHDGLITTEAIYESR